MTFADDIALLAQTFEHADLMLQAVALVGREAGLEINVEKTKVLVVGDLARTEPGRSHQTKQPSRLQHRTTPEGVRGSVVTRHNKTSALIDPNLFNACEAWTLTETTMKRLRVGRGRLLRRALTLNVTNHIPPNSFIR